MEYPVLFSQDALADESCRHAVVDIAPLHDVVAQHQVSFLINPLGTTSSRHRQGLRRPPVSYQVVDPSPEHMCEGPTIQHEPVLISGDSIHSHDSICHLLQFHLQLLNLLWCDTLCSQVGQLFRDVVALALIIAAVRLPVTLLVA